MWGIKNHTEFECSSGVTRDLSGGEVWLICIKGTFNILPDSSVITAEDQMPVLRVPEYAGEEGKSRLLYDRDMVPVKKKTDVILHAKAYAPANRNVTSLNVSVRIAAITPLSPSQV